MLQSEYCYLTGATARQLDYWYKNGINMLAEDPQHEGSGHYRNYDWRQADKIRLLVKLSNLKKDLFSVETLKEVFNNYDDGMILLAQGLLLVWEPV